MEWSSGESSESDGYFPQSQAWEGFIPASLSIFQPDRDIMVSTDRWATDDDVHSPLVIVPEGCDLSDPSWKDVIFGGMNDPAAGLNRFLDKMINAGRASNHARQARRIRRRNPNRTRLGVENNYRRIADD